MNTREEIILGVDPGTRVTGYGVLKGSQTVLDFGCIRPSQKLSIHERYLFIFNGIDFLIEKYNPTAVAIETQFIFKNPATALKLGMARGAVIIAAARQKVSIFEYAPKKAKLAVVGNGAASKEQVQKMVQLLLNLSCIPEPEDAADALALALCHSNTLRRPYARLH
jgi:crossover junction endodeoxyribonuclease RuvC